MTEFEIWIPEIALKEHIKSIISHIHFINEQLSIPSDFIGNYLFTNKKILDSLKLSKADDESKFKVELSRIFESIKQNKTNKDYKISVPNTWQERLALQAREG